MSSIRIASSIRLAAFLVAAPLTILFDSAHAQMPANAETSGIIKLWPELKQAIESNTDLWGEQALALPGGPSYEFFKSRMPTFHYVDAAFRHYPIVLSGPSAARKARLVSNGSAVNARAAVPRAWKEIGTAVTFHVGDTGTTFGDDLHQLSGPGYLRGYLPVVEMTYAQQGDDYSLEAFTPVDKAIVDNAPVLLQFGLGKGSAGSLTADVNATASLTASAGTLRDASGRLFVAYDKSWKWDAANHQLTTALTSKTSATLAIFTEPLESSVRFAIDIASYLKLRKECCDAWDALLNRGTQIETPETVVNNAWRALVIGNYMLLNRDRMHYSAGNQYDKLYEAEGGDAVRSLMLFGQLADVPRMIIPLLDFTRRGLEYHQAGLKLQLLTRYYSLSHDGAFVNAQRPRWQKEVDKILNDRETSTGLLPREQYAGDIATKVYSLNSNANSWRGLREISTVLGEMGNSADAAHYADEAAKFRKVVVDAATRSIDRSTTVPFVPLALFGELPVIGRLSATRLGGYYDLMLPYIVGSRIFGPGTDAENWMVQTMEQRGALCMGMIRGAGMSKMYGGVTGGFNNLYTLRLTVAQLERDEVDRALVSFYGKLAQGMTWDTFISGEGSGMAPYDEWGRPFFAPPNSAANGYFLHMLRYMLVQDWDLDDDGKPETLRLLFGTPRAWMEDGAKVRVDRAPTSFGDVAVSSESHLSRGEVLVKVTAPSRNAPTRTLLRCRLPAGHEVLEATSNGKKLALDDKHDADVSALRGSYTVRFKVR